MTNLDSAKGCARIRATHGPYRLLAKAGEDGLDMPTLTDAASGRRVTLREARVHALAFLQHGEAIRRVPRAVTQELEAWLMALHGRPRTLAERVRVETGC